MEEFKFNTEEIETPKFSEEIFNIKDKKLKTKKIKEIPDSPFRTDILANYYGSKPILVKWKHWVLMCNLIRNSDTFKKLYAKENFKYGDLEETAFVVYPVFTKEPQTVKNLDGKIIEEISGIYDEENTLVLPPKFIFPIYRRYFLSSIELAPYLNETQPEIMNFEGYNYVMNFGPRGEQLELAEMAGNALKGQKYFKGIIQAAPGWGKGVDNEILLETPCGNIRMGDIKEGDMVFGSNGKPTEVLKVYPQGKMRRFKFTFGDTTSTIVDESHLWTVWNTDGKKWQTLSTKEIMSKNYARPEKDKRYGDKSNGMRYKYFIPLCKPVEYNFDISDPSRNKGLQPLQHCFHPYALGLMLGDGSFRLKGNGFSFTDKFNKNIDKLKETIQLNNYLDDITGWEKCETNNSFLFRSKKLKEISKILGLDGKYSIEKHIPKEYLYASVESRKLLLEGLIATDGYVRTNSSWSYSTSSSQLRDDVCKLARSLGYYVTVKTNENNTYFHAGEKRQTQNTNWEICINYKKERKAIVNIEELEEGETTCILVEADDSLFLCNDYIVTHNTYISINIGSQTKGQVLVIVPNNLLAGQWKKSILEFTNLTEDDIGMIKGSDLEKLKKKGIHKKPFNIVLIQSLDSQLQRANFNELIDFYKNTSIVFYDETHTSGAADGYAKTSGIFTTYNILGLSATPYKKDKNLFQLYTGIGQIVYISTHQNLIPSCNMHLLDTPITQKEQRELFDIFQKTNYNFFMSKLEDYLFKVDAYFVYIAEWLIFRYKQGFSTVVLFKTNKMLEKLQIFLNRLKGDLEIKSTILTNETAKKNQKELGSSNVILSNYKMFSAGADYPFLSCIFFASMVLSKTTLIQSLGRVTRKHDTKIQEVQAHFLIPKFIYPLYSNNEPHITIVRGVKVGYPTAQFKWDKGFTTFFDERKKASENLNSNQYASAQYPGQQIPNQNVRGDFIIQPSTQDLSNNRLEAFRQHKQMMESINNGGTGLEHIEKPKGFF